MAKLATDFDWTPKSVPLSYTIGGNTYPPSTQADSVSRASDARYLSYTTPTNTLLTFTASVVLPPNVFIAEYRWDFGDGTVGYGPTVNHTYATASSQTAPVLVVTDSLGNRASRSHVLNLRQTVPIVVSLGARVA
jgi:hypothetical protein